jgi:hypothetical protein
MRSHELRTASCAENWYPRTDNPWTHFKFQYVRRRVAGLIIELQKTLRR